MGRTWGSWGLSLERIRNDTGNEVWGKGTVSRVCCCTDPSSQHYGARLRLMLPAFPERNQILKVDKIKV